MKNEIEQIKEDYHNGTLTRKEMLRQIERVKKDKIEWWNTKELLIENYKDETRD